MNYLKNNSLRGLCGNRKLIFFCTYIIPKCFNMLFVEPANIKCISRATDTRNTTCVASICRVSWKIKHYTYINYCIGT